MTDKAWFSGALDMRAYKPGEWVLLEPFRFHSATGEEFTVPKWFITDLASIPWIVEPLFDDVDHRDAGVVHDWLYCSQVVTRAQADALFKEMVQLLGASATQANLMYAGLRVGGGSHWGKGPQREDFAWEFMTRAEQASYERWYFGGPDALVASR